MTTVTRLLLNQGSQGGHTLHSGAQYYAVGLEVLPQVNLSIRHLISCILVIFLILSFAYGADPSLIFQKLEN